MTRTTGAKNKPKDSSYFIEKARQLAEREGKHLQFTFGETLPKIEKGDIAGAVIGETKQKIKEGIQQTQDNLPKKIKITKPEVKEVENTGDTYKCGQCGCVMDKPVVMCPKCGAGLKWED